MRFELGNAGLKFLSSYQNGALNGQYYLARDVYSGLLDTCSLLCSDAPRRGPHVGRSCSRRGDSWNVKMCATAFLDCKPLTRAHITPRSHISRPHDGHTLHTPQHVRARFTHTSKTERSRRLTEGISITLNHAEARFSQEHQYYAQLPSVHHTKFAHTRVSVRTLLLAVRGLWT